jgi:predicted nucleic acid-binding protein
MPFVLDASVAACWAFEDETHAAADSALERIRFDEAVVPSLWWFEVRNILIVNERRGRIIERQTSAFLGFLTTLPVAIDRQPDEGNVMALSRRHRLTFYDASYLELAVRSGIALATLDAQLLRAAGAETVEILGSFQRR